MSQFYCREDELRKLNKRYAGDKFERIVIYGRRRVGKTALINEFCKDKPTIFFSALNTTGKENLEALSKSIMSFERPDMESAPEFRSYDAALDELTALSKEKRIVFVIDEYPYLAKAKPAISAMLQHIIDHYSNASPYILPVLAKDDSYGNYRQQQRELNKFIRKIGVLLNIPEPLTFYVARHSWATLARDCGTPLTVISAGMGHTSERTTRIYLAQLDHNIIDKANRKIIDLQ